MYHTVNAWEEGDEVVLVGCRIDQPFADGTVDEPVPTIASLRLAPNFWEWRFDLRTGTTRERPLDDAMTEFPRMDNRRLGRPSRYSYHQVCAPPLDAAVRGVDQVRLRRRLRGRDPPLPGRLVRRRDRRSPPGTAPTARTTATWSPSWPRRPPGPPSSTCSTPDVRPTSRSAASRSPSGCPPATTRGGSDEADVGEVSVASEAVFVLGGAQTDFARNLTREGTTLAELCAEVAQAGMAAAGVDAGRGRGRPRRQLRRRAVLRAGPPRRVCWSRPTRPSPACPPCATSRPARRGAWPCWRPWPTSRPGATTARWCSGSS